MKKVPANSPMDCALDITTSQELQSIAGVDGQGGILRLNPLTLVRVRVANLEGSNGLTEEESEGPKICGGRDGQHENLVHGKKGFVRTSMATYPVRKLLVLLRRVFRIFHVTEVALRSVERLKDGKERRHTSLFTGY